MALDPRLACVELLALAAMRAKQHQADAPTQSVVLQIEYDAYGDEPPLLGERYVLALPRKRRASRRGTGPRRASGSQPRPAPVDAI